MEQDEAPGPVQVGFFGGIAVVLGADGRAHLLQPDRQRVAARRFAAERRHRRQWRREAQRLIRRTHRNRVPLAAGTGHRTHQGRRIRDGPALPRR